MSALDEFPASIAFLIGLSRARLRLQRGRLVPVLAVGRLARGFGGARGTGGELPWAAGRMPVFVPGRDGAPGTTASTTITTVVSAGAAPAPVAASVLRLERGVPPVPPRPEGAAPPVASDMPHHRSAAAPNRAAPPAASPATTAPVPPAARLAEVAPGLVFAAGARREAVRAVPPGRPSVAPRPPGQAALPHVIRPHAIQPHAIPAEQATAAAAPPPIRTSADPPAAALPVRVTLPVAAHPTSAPPPLPPRDPALPWIAQLPPAVGSPAPPGPLPVRLPSSALPAPAATAPSPLVQRDPRAAPVSVSNVIALGERIERSFRQEIDEVRAIVARIGEWPSATAPAPSPAAISGTARHLLNQMRTLLQEEQFRRGHLR